MLMLFLATLSNTFTIKLYENDMITCVAEKRLVVDQHEEKKMDLFSFRLKH